MNKSVINIISIGVLFLVTSCEDNLKSPFVNPDISSNKKALLEVFTSITCLNCIQANIYCDNITSLKGMTINDTNVLIINYHPSFFPTDPFYQFNKELNIERQQYYDISFIPSGFCDGNSLPPPFSASEWTNQINGDLAKYNEAVIFLENTLDTISRSGSIKIITEQREPVENGDLKLFLIITENNIYYNAPAGNKYYNNIAREMINQTEGEPIVLTPGQTTTIIKNYTVRSGIEILNSTIIAFIQVYNTKKIIAVEKLALY